MLLPLQGVSGNTLSKTQGAASLTLGYVLVGPSARLAPMAVGPSVRSTEQFQTIRSFRELRKLFLLLCKNARFIKGGFLAAYSSSGNKKSFTLLLPLMRM